MGQKNTWLNPVRDDPYIFFCTICKKALFCSHGSRANMTRHNNRSNHMKMSESVPTQSKLYFNNPEDIQAIGLT